MSGFSSDVLVGAQDLLGSIWSHGTSAYDLCVEAPYMNFRANVSLEVLLSSEGGFGTYCDLDLTSAGPGFLGS